MFRWFKGFLKLSGTKVAPGCEKLTTYNYVANVPRSDASHNALRSDANRSLAPHRQYTGSELTAVPFIRTMFNDDLFSLTP